MINFRRAIVRPPPTTFAEGLTKSGLGAPDYKLAQHQHEKYCEALATCGLEVIELPADERFPDSTFVEDTAVITAHGAILTRPGAPSRAGEVESIGKSLAQYFPVLDRIEAPGTVDGGDICEAGKTLFIGISDRTNEVGARQLAGWARQAGYETKCVSLSGLPQLLHLKSGLAYVGDTRLVVTRELAGHPSLSEYELITVESAESYGANCVRINDYVLVAAGHPVLAARLSQAGYQTLELAMSEFQKMDGGLSCLSLRF